MKHMNRERYQRIRAIFEEVCDSPQEQRVAILDSACGDDQRLRTDVEALLAHLDTPAFGFDDPESARLELLADLAANDRRPDTALPEHIGPYRVLRLLGEGGMGVVYLAEQENPRRTVAIKIIRPGFTTPALLRRFEHEAHVLGRLQHPGIAQIFSAGTANAGLVRQPYLVMEYIEGSTLLEYAHAHQMSTRQRLELFIRICEAVQHAHQRGIIHRDLKPANILVVDETAEPRGHEVTKVIAELPHRGTPKILDFGVARASDPEVQVTTLAAGGGQFIGTLPYMSPEQVGGDVVDIDTRCDVYALGVILFELLTGRLPHDFTKRSVPEITRVIREEEPIRLSEVDQRWRGDLDTMVAKALEKDRHRRYQTVRELSQDITRHLADEPILARRASVIYQFRKFARRNKAMVFGVAAVIGVLSAAAIISSMLLVRALHAEHEMMLALNEAKEARAEAESALEREAIERAVSERQVRIVQAVNEFVANDLLAHVDPYRGGGSNVTLRTVVDQASAVLDHRFGDELIIRAAIHETLGRTYDGLGLYEPAEHHLRAAVEILTEEAGPAATVTIAARNHLANLLVVSRQCPDAEPFVRETLALAEASLGQRQEHVVIPLNCLGIIMKRRGKFAEAEQYYRLAFDTARETLGRDHRTTLAIMNNLGIVLSDQGKHDEAEAIMREILDIRRQTQGPRHPETAFALLNLGHVYWTQSTAHEELEALWRQSHEIFEEALGPEHPHTLRPLYGLALLKGARGDFAEAERLHREVLDLRLRVLPEDHREVLLTKQVLAGMIRRQGQHRLAEAEAIYREILPMRQRQFGVEHGSTRRTRGDLLNLLRQRGDNAGILEVQRQWIAALREAAEAPDAEPNLIGTYAWRLLTIDTEELRDPAAALAAAERAASLTDRSDPDALDTLAFALAENGRFDEAIVIQIDAIRHSAEINAQAVTVGDENQMALEARRRLASTFSKAQRYDEAEIMLAEVINMYDDAIMFDNVNKGLALLDRGRCLLQLNRLAEAEQCLHQSFQILHAALGESHDLTQQTLQSIAELDAAMGMGDVADG